MSNENALGAISETRDVADLAMDVAEAEFFYTERAEIWNEVKVTRIKDEFYYLAADNLIIARATLMISRTRLREALVSMDFA